jgi:hypothetical protein
VIFKCLDALVLLAARGDLPRVWGRFDHQRPSGGMSQLWLVAGLAALAAAAMLLWLRGLRRPKRCFVSNSQGRLFRELSAAHGVSFSNRRLLKRLARERKLPTPALLFVEPKHFDTSDLPADLQSAANELQRLRAQLFE